MEYIEVAKNELINWVARRGSGNFIDKDYLEMSSYGLPDNFGMQQVKEEIFQFADVLYERKPKTILEIGLGYYGSTHFLWRMLANHVATIEKNQDRIRAFGENMKDYYKRWMLDDGKSSFFFGYSHEPAVVKKVYNHFNAGVDVLFIDGDHSYKGVMADWLLYSPLVVDGGVIAFHDIELFYDHDEGPKAFVHDLEGGSIDGSGHKITRIQHSKYAGIGYYLKNVTKI